MTGTRADVAAALLERIRALTETLDVNVTDAYEEAFEGGSIIYLTDITGSVQPHGGTSEPFRWRDEFTINVEIGVLQVAPDDPNDVRRDTGELIDLVIDAVSTCWDVNDDRTRLVEPGADLEVEGPNAGYWAEQSRRVSFASISIDLARQIQPVTEETI